MGCPPPKEDTGLYVVIGGKEHGPIKHPAAVTVWNDFFWWYIDLPDFRGGAAKIVRTSGGGWLWTDALILTQREGYDPRKPR